jgi:type I restriction enzyme, S subunit
MIDISPHDLKTVKRLLADYFPNVEARVFGSRYQWTAKDYSDLDIVLVGSQKLDWLKLDRLREAFAESDLPFRVDVLDWHVISPEFQQVIERGYEVIQKSRPLSSQDGPVNHNNQKADTSSDVNTKASLVGAIPTTWQVTSIGEICDATGGFVQTGPFGSQLHASDYQESGTPVVMPKNLGNNSIDPSDIARIGPDDVKRLEKHKLETGDIIFPRRGDITRFAYVTEEYAGWLCGTGCLKIHVGRGKVSTKYLSYYLAHPSIQDWIVGNAVGTTMLNLNTSIVRDLPVVLPPQDEQKAIATILSAFDDKIELNQQMNATLEEMARALFKSWFVDFDPVRRNQAGQPSQPYDHLFPDKLVVDGNGREVPAGWQIVPMKHIANLERNSIRPETLPHEEFDYFSFPAYDNGQEAVPTTGSDIKSSKYVVPHNSVLLSKLNPRTPRIWLANPSQKRRPICSTEFLVMLPLENATREYLYSLYMSNEFMNRFSKLVTGTSSSHQRVKPKQFLSIETIHPPIQLVQTFTSIVEPFFDKIYKNRLESRTLADLRNTLLPRLMSGRLRVPIQEVSV